jgi:Nuclease-related domain
MSGQETAGASSSASPRPERGGMSLDEADLPIWAIADADGGDRPDPPEDTGLSVPPVPPAEPDQESEPQVIIGRGKISHFARDSRMPVWRRRLIIAAVAGIGFTIWIDWRVGLTMAVLAGIADAAIRARSTAASAAEGMTSSAQRRTKKQLSQLERAGYRALHIRAIPGSVEVIDHLLIGPTGVYAIDSEEWDKRLPVRTKNGRQLWHGPFSQKGRLEHARWEAARASELVGNALGEPIEVRPAMAVYGPAIPWGVATIREVDVFSGSNLRKYLRKHPFGGRARPRLATAEIERIYTVAQRVLPPKR